MDLPRKKSKRNVFGSCFCFTLVELEAGNEISYKVLKRDGNEWTGWNPGKEVIIFEGKSAVNGKKRELNYISSDMYENFPSLSLSQCMNHILAISQFSSSPGYFIDGFPLFGMLLEPRKENKLREARLQILVHEEGEERKKKDEKED